MKTVVRDNRIFDIEVVFKTPNRNRVPGIKYKTLYFQASCFVVRLTREKYPS